MNKNRLSTIVGCCGIALTALAWSQSQRKAGLWEVTSQMSMAGAPQMPQLPPGTQLPPGMTMPQMQSPFAPQTAQVCVSQAMIDKYGSPYSNPPRGDCKITNISMRSDGASVTMVCTGQMNATGTMETTFVDANTTKSSVHITGTMQSGPNSWPIDMTIQSTSTYKGADCGSVQPLAMPPSQ